MSKLWYNGVYFGSNDSRDVYYDTISVYDKLKEIDKMIASGEIGSGGSSGDTIVTITSSFLEISDTLTLERNGCGRVLQFKGKVTLSSIQLTDEDKPLRSVKASLQGKKSDGNDFLDVITVNTDGTVTSDYREYEDESVEYYGSAIWVVESTEGTGSSSGESTSTTNTSNIRYNSETKNVEIYENGSWVVFSACDCNDVEVVSELPETVDNDTFYIVTPNTSSSEQTE